MSRMTKIMDGFLRDENGKIHTEPLKLPADFSENRRKRKYIPIQPLDVHALFQSLDQETKKPKLERPIRKELFKVPPKQSRKRLSYKTRGSITQSVTSSNKQGQAKSKGKTFLKHTDGSPLLDVEEAEKLLSSKRILPSTGPMNTVLFPLKSVREELGSSMFEKTDSNQIENSPCSTNSDVEFLQFEKKFASVKKNTKKMETASSLTPNCSLLKSTKITNNDKKSCALTNQLNLLIKQDEEQRHLLYQQFQLAQKQFQLLSQQFEQYQQEHPMRFEKIIELVSNSGKDTEIKNRRSDRIAEKNNMKTKYVVSPAISKSVDLRKTALNKNLAKNLQNTPMKKAVDMYNSFRNNCTILDTPRMDRTVTESQGSVSVSLSRRIQTQCLLLQDTPKPYS